MIIFEKKFVTESAENYRRLKRAFSDLETGRSCVMPQSFSLAGILGYNVTDL